MKQTIKKIFILLSLFLVAGFFMYQVQGKVLAEQSGSSPESGATSRIKTIYDSLVSLSHGSDSAGGWGNWGVMWNRIRSAAEWVPTGDATEGDVASGKIFYKDSRTQKTGTLSLTGDATAADVAYGKTFYASDLTKQTGTYCPTTFTTCGQCYQVTHQDEDGVAPVDKTVSYQTVSTSIGGTGTKCWITQNLGATHQATDATDATEDSAGWYWQFNRKQGYKHDGTTRTPSSAWISSISEDSDWLAENDPCTLELGVGWRLPTWVELGNVDTSQNWNNYNDTYGSVLKVHGAGYIEYSNGNFYARGSYGQYWSSTQNVTVSNARLLGIDSSYSGYDSARKAYGSSIRCVKD